jgi:hypothetical protein
VGRKEKDANKVKEVRGLSAKSSFCLSERQAGRNLPGRRERERDSDSPFPETRTTPTASQLLLRVETLEPSLEPILQRHQLPFLYGRQRLSRFSEGARDGLVWAEEGGVVLLRRTEGSLGGGSLAHSTGGGGRSSLEGGGDGTFRGEEGVVVGRGGGGLGGDEGEEREEEEGEERKGGAEMHDSGRSEE